MTKPLPIILFLGIVVVFLFICSPLYAVDNLRLPDIRSLSIGGNGATQAVLFNPALISLSGKRLIQFNYYNRYSLKELGHYNGNIQYPNSLLDIGLQVSSFGYDEYRESMFRLCMGKRLGERWSLGIGVQYSLLQTELFDERPAYLSTDIGVTFFPFDKLLIGMLIMNVPSVSIGDEMPDINNFINYLCQIGIEYQIINNLLIMGSLGSEEEEAITGNIGIEYTVFDSFHIRSGIQTTPLVPSMGVGYELSSFSIDAVATWHSVLGVSMGIGLSFSF